MRLLGFADRKKRRLKVHITVTHSFLTDNGCLSLALLAIKCLYFPFSSHCLAIFLSPQSSLPSLFTRWLSSFLSHHCRQSLPQLVHPLSPSSLQFRSVSASLLSSLYLSALVLSPLLRLIMCPSSFLILRERQHFSVIILSHVHFFAALSQRVKYKWTASLILILSPQISTSSKIGLESTHLHAHLSVSNLKRKQQI